MLDWKIELEPAAPYEYKYKRITKFKLKNDE